MSTCRSAAQSHEFLQDEKPESTGDGQCHDGEEDEWSIPKAGERSGEDGDPGIAERAHGMEDRRPDRVDPPEVPAPTQPECECPHTLDPEGVAHDRPQQTPHIDGQTGFPIMEEGLAPES